VTDEKVTVEFYAPIHDLVFRFVPATEVPLPMFVVIVLISVGVIVEVRSLRRDR
jgi:hypothetical protein